MYSSTTKAYSPESTEFISLCPDLAVRRPGSAARSLPPGKPGLLLVRLALAAGRAYGRDHLVESVWPECDSELGRPRLRFALTVVRNDFGLAHVVIASKNEVGLDWSRVDTDVERFRRLLRKAETTKDPAERVGLLVQTCAEVKADLAEQYTAPWLEGPRQELRNLRTGAMIKLASLAADGGDFTTAERAIKEAITLDRTKEALQAELMRILDRGGRTAEAVANFEEYRRSLHRELGLQPSQTLRRLAEELGRSASPPRANSSGVGRGEPTSRVAERRSFIGREALMQEIEQALEGHAVVTLTGLGGVGKTRLAAEIYRSNHSSENRFVDLSDAATGEDVLSSLLTAYEVRGKAEHGVRRELIERLRASGGLLVLDNCEQVLDGVRELATEVTNGVPNLRILATSRKRLGTLGEYVVEVSGLSVPPGEDPPSTEELSKSPSVSLFLQAARAADRGFALTENNSAYVIKLLRAVDGLPLSIELAAARLRLMPLDQVLERLEEGPDILSSQRGPTRHRRVSEIVEWSISSLSEDARTLLQRLAVFATGWNLSAAAEAMGEAAGTGCAVADALEELAENALVSQVGAHRFRMLESIRPIAMRHLAEQGKVRAAREAHLRAYLAIYEPLADKWRSRDAGAWRDQVESDMPNLRLALKWAASRARLEDPDQSGERLAWAIWPYWIRGGSNLEGLALLHELLEAHPPRVPNKLTAKLMTAIAQLEMRRSNLGVAEEMQRRALAMSRALGDRSTEIRGLMNLADMEIMRRDGPKGEAFFREALRLSESVGDPWAIGMSLEGIGRSFLLRNEHVQAAPYLEQALEHARATQDDTRIGTFLNNLADNLMYLGDFHRAREHLMEALEIDTRTKNRFAQSVVYVNIGLIALEEGDCGEARRMQLAALDIQKRIGEPRRIGRTLYRLGVIAFADGDIGEAHEKLGASMATLDACAEGYEAALPRLFTAIVHSSAGDHEKAVGPAIEALEVLVTDTGPVGTALALQVAGGLCVHLGSASDGAILLGASDGVRARRHMIVPRVERALAAKAAEMARCVLGDEFDLLHDSGARLTDDEALQFALERLREV